MSYKEAVRGGDEECVCLSVCLFVILSSLHLKCNAEKPVFYRQQGD